MKPGARASIPAVKGAFGCLLISACAVGVQNPDREVVLAHPPASPAGIPASYVAVPGGFYDPACIAPVHPGETVLDDGSIQQTGGGVRDVPACASPAYDANGQPIDGPAPQATSAGSALNGWVEDESTASIGALAMLQATWTVPQPPANPGDGQLDYFFNGLEGGPTILQPVMTFFGGKWTATSWNCCKKGTTYHGNTIDVSPGDVLVGTMTGSDCDTTTGVCNSWQIETLDRDTQQASVLATSSWGSAETWVFAGVLEAYGVKSCSDLPASGDLVFANQSYTTVSGAPATATWHYHDYPRPVSCGYGGAQDSAGTNVTITFPGAAQGGVTTRSTYALHAAGNGFCLDVSGGASIDGTPIIEDACTGTPDQLFTMFDAGSGHITLFNASSDKCIDAVDGGTAAGTPIQLYDCDGTAAQSFALTPNATGAAQLVHVASGLCVGQSAQTTQLVLVDCSAASAVAWEPEAGSLTLGGSYALFSGASEFTSCMDVVRDGSSNGTPVQQHACNGTPAQELTVVDAGGGLISLYHPSSGKCVDVTGGATVDGTRIELYKCNGGAAQRFAVHDDGLGNATFVHAASGKCIDVTGGSPNDGTPLQLWDCNQSAAQQWFPVAE
jgi:hypothetical protein